MTSEHSDAAGDPQATFHSLSPEFHAAYFKWHSSGQYDGVEEFKNAEDAYRRPPPRERDCWYGEELQIIDTHYKKLAPSRVLEIGCGDGNLTWKLARRCRQLRAIDMDPLAVDLTRLRLRDLRLENVDVACRGGHDVRPEDRAAYDVVFFVQVLEHVPGWVQGELFDAVFSFVAPGGCVFISTPNRWAIRDSHDTDRLFIHWGPRWLRVPVARALNWGIRGQDPCWPYPPVLHDYVSFRWMLKRARRVWPTVKTSGMSFYPTAEEWFAARAVRECGRRLLARRLLKVLGGVLPLNYYFGEKAVFIKA